MSKKIASLGLTFEGSSITNSSFNSRSALMDYDLIILFPHSHTKISDITYWNQEIENFLRQGKNIYIFVFPENNNILDILPFSFVDRIYKTGSGVYKQQKSVLDKFYETYKDRFTYYMTYSQTSPESQIIFTGTDKTHILGSVLTLESKSHCVLLPCVNTIAPYNDIFYINSSTESELLIDIIIDIDNQLSTKDTKNPPPEWVQNPIYNSPTEISTINEIETIKNNIKQLEQREEELSIMLDKEQEFKGLLFETGKSLENIIIASLHILGYVAENFTKGEDEIDVIFKSQEELIYCGECEGKNEKAIGVSKFRQLLEHTALYKEHLEFQKDVYGVIFGNASRLQELETREEFFTEHCITGAEKNNFILIKTPDLYPIVQYLREHDDDDAFKKQCRDAIHNGLGGIVQFPNIPN